jgi:hypothetical protein
VSDANIDPAFVEKAFSTVEGDIAPILRSIDKERREPDVEEIGLLLYFMAIQFARVPSFRPFVFNLLDSVMREDFLGALESKATWERALKRAGMSPHDPGADYESIKKFAHSGEYRLMVEPEWYIQQTFEAAEQLFPLLRKRIWRAVVSTSGNFIGCDNPVILDGPKGQMIGFANAEIITYALSRHVLMYGTLKPWPRPYPNRKYVALMNTSFLLRTDAQVFSHVPDFCWLDENRAYQTNWKSFSRENFNL